MRSAVTISMYFSFRWRCCHALATLCRHKKSSIHAGLRYAVGALARFAHSPIGQLYILKYKIPYKAYMYGCRQPTFFKNQAFMRVCGLSLLAALAIFRLYFFKAFHLFRFFRRNQKQRYALRVDNGVDSFADGIPLSARLNQLLLLQIR